jgi:serine/threonine protein kinase
VKERLRSLSQLDVNGRAKLSDFGTARRLDNDTKATSVVGTLNFMAPEVMDELPYDEKADIYS